MTDEEIRAAIKEEVKAAIEGIQFVVNRIVQQCPHTRGRRITTDHPVGLSDTYAGDYEPWPWRGK